MDQTTTELAFEPGQDAAAAFEAAIVAQHTVSSALLHWCETHGIGEGEILAGDIERWPDAARSALHSLPTPPHALIAAPQTLAYRRVRLRRGEVALAQAEIWYEPCRLPENILRDLAASPLPFGRAVESLSPYRETIEVRRHPLDLLEPGSVFLETGARLLAGSGVEIGLTRERFFTTLIPPTA